MAYQTMGYSRLSARATCPHCGQKNMTNMSVVASPQSTGPLIYPPSLLSLLLYFFHEHKHSYWEHVHVPCMWVYVDHNLTVDSNATRSLDRNLSLRLSAGLLLVIPTISWNSPLYNRVMYVNAYICAVYKDVYTYEYICLKNGPWRTTVFGKYLAHICKI